jgi:hypothetical protein
MKTPPCKLLIARGIDFYWCRRRELAPEKSGRQTDETTGVFKNAQTRSRTLPTLKLGCVQTGNRAAAQDVKCSIINHDSSATTGGSKMKVAMALVVSLALMLGACTTTAPAPAQPGPAGPAGQQGQAGQSGQQGDTGQTGQQGNTGAQGNTGVQGNTGAQGQQGQTAPCPAGQHRSTNPNTGEVHCVEN